MISGANSDQALCPPSIDAGLQTSQSTAFNTLSGATMIDSGNSPLHLPPVSMITITPASSNESVASSASSDSRPFVPNPKIHELRLLTKDMDFTPSTPIKKQQISALGVGTPHTPNRKTNDNAPSKFNSNIAARKTGAPEPRPPSQRQEMYAAKGSTQNNQGLTRDPSSSSLIDFGVFATPHPMYQGRNPSESGSSAGGVSSDGSTTDLTWGLPHIAKDMGTPSKRGGYRLQHTGPAAVGGTPMRKAKSEVYSPSRHAHSKSEANMLGNRMKSVLMVRSQSVNEMMTSAPTNGSSPGGRRVKSTQEKKELLGTCLGNIDALVEGMKKAGAWGLV